MPSWSYLRGVWVSGAIVTVVTYLLTRDDAYALGIVLGHMVGAWTVWTDWRDAERKRARDQA